MDNATYRITMSKTPAPDCWRPDYEPEPDEENEAAIIFHRAAISLLDACFWSPNRLAVALGRVGGLSYRQIGVRLKMSPEGVRKHLNCITERNPALGDMLKTSFPVQAAFIPSLQVSEIENHFQNQLRAIIQKGGVNSD